MLKSAKLIKIFINLALFKSKIEEHNKICQQL
jgi:hypothetical protein